MAETQTRIHLASLASRLALVVFLCREIIAGLAVLKVIPWGRRLHFFLFDPRATGRSIRYAIAISFAGWVLEEIVSRLILKPLVQSWLTPRADSSAGLFRAAAGERMIHEVPARWRRGERSWTPGTLFLTDRRIWFLPAEWDEEPWQGVPLERIAVRLVPAPALAWGLIDGLPDRLAIESTGGAAEIFALRSPAVVQAWVQSSPERAGASSQPSLYHNPA